MDPHEGFILASFNVGGLREMIEAADVRLLCPPLYCFGFNTIEMGFPKLKVTL